MYTARIQHELRRNILANVRFSYTDNQYEFDGPKANSLKDTQVSRAGLGLSYLFNRYMYISAGYTYEKQDANSPEFEYKANRWFITFGAEF